MSSTTRRSTHRIGTALATALVLVAGAAAFTPVVPRVHAVDPTPGPSVSSPDPGPTPTPADPTPAPTPDPTPTPPPQPTPDPTIAPEVTPSIAVTPAPTPPDPTLSPDPSPTADPAAGGTPLPDPGSPAPSVDPSPSPSDTASPSPDPSASPSDSPSPSPVVPLEVSHFWVDRLNGDGSTGHTGSLDTGLGDMQRFVVYRVRFQVANPGGDVRAISPRIEAGVGTDPSDWIAVPEVDPVADRPFYAASDRGRTFEPRTATLTADRLRGPAPLDGLSPADGIVSSGVNPTGVVVLPAASYTEIAFDVRATIDARWSSSYAFRLADSGSELLAGPSVTVTLDSRPPIVTTLPSSGDALGAAQPQYALRMGPTPAAASLPLTVDPNGPHVATSLAADGCAGCHSAHRATNAELTTAAYREDPLLSATEAYDGRDFSLCLACHDESPFADQSGSASALTNFAGHGYHLGHIEGKGTGGTSLNWAGDGQGNAVCAECHYAIHVAAGTARGMVRFSPNVLPYNGVIGYDLATQSCTLTFHGKVHDGLTFAGGN